MFTSDIKKTVLRYLGAAVFCVLVNGIYGRFSHGVSSGYMTYMFLYPLLGGTILIFLQRYISSFFRTVYGCGVFTLTLGSFLQGVLIIAGTDSPYVKAYFIAGGLLLLGSFISFKISKQSKVAK